MLAIFLSVRLGDQADHMRRYCNSPYQVVVGNGVHVLGQSFQYHLIFSFTTSHMGCLSWCDTHHVTDNKSYRQEQARGAAGCLHLFKFIPYPSRLNNTHHQAILTRPYLNLSLSVISCPLQTQPHCNLNQRCSPNQNSYHTAMLNTTPSV